MKITFLLPSLGIGGGIRSTLEIANRLCDRGHSVSIVYPLFPSKFKRSNPLKKIGRIGKSFLKGNKLNWFDLKAELIRVPSFKENWIPDSDIIVATWWGNAHEYINYGKEKGKKFYFIRHYETFDGPINLVEKTYTMAVHKLVTSVWLKDIMKEKFDIKVLGPLLNGVDFNIFYKEKKDVNYTHLKRIGMMYRRAKWKGMKQGLDAFFKVKKRYSDIQLVLFGEKTSAEDKAIINKLKNIEFHYLPYGEKLRKLYNSLDIFVFPSHFEGFGDPPMEAMACGVACVCTSVGAVPEYTIAGETALVVPPKDTAILAEKIEILLANEEKQKEIAEKGYNYIQQFTWDKTVDQLEKIFKRYN